MITIKNNIDHCIYCCVIDWNTLLYLSNLQFHPFYEGTRLTLHYAELPDHARICDVTS